MSSSPASPASPGRRWWSAGPDPDLPTIGPLRAYAEVLGVYLAFFAVAIVAAGLLLANRFTDIPEGASWSIYMTQVVDDVAQIGLAVALVLLVAARRKVTPASLGLGVPRLPDGRIAVSRTIRIAAWSFFALILGGIVNAALQTGELPLRHANAPQLVFAVFDSLQAGVIEEMVVLAFVVVTLRQARRPWWEVTVVALVLRGAYHIYYGPGVLGILVWAALFYWIYVRSRQLLPLIVCHTLWDVVAFTSRATLVVAGVGEALVAILWITAIILWLAERNNRPYQPPAGFDGGWPGWPAGFGGGAPGWPAGYGNGFGHAGSDPSGATWAGSPNAGALGPARRSEGPPPMPANSDASVVAAAAPPATPPPIPTPIPTPIPVPPGTYASVPVRAPSPPPGWHPDPAGHNRWRWWDGYRWTEHVSPHS